MVSEIVASPGSITIVPPSPADASQVAEAIALFAPRYGHAPLVVLADGDAPQWAPWREELTGLLGERAMSLRFRTVAATTPGELARIFGAEPSRLIVAVAGAPATREALLDMLAGPVLVLPRRERA